MKDFYDFWLLSQQFGFNSARLAEAIQLTSYRRGTPLPDGMDIFTGAFTESKQTQGLHSEEGFDKPTFLLPSMRFPLFWMIFYTLSSKPHHQAKQVQEVGRPLALGSEQNIHISLCTLRFSVNKHLGLEPDPRFSNQP